MSNSAFQPTVLTVPASGSSTGQGELNIVTNSIAASDTTGWTGAQQNSGGGPLSPTIGTYFTVSATNSGEGASSGAYASLTLPSSLQNKKLKVEFYYTSFADVYYVSVRKAGVRVPLSTDSAGATALPINSTGKFVAYFDTDSSGSWTVHLTRSAGDASSLQFTNVVVGPGIQPQGAVVGEWQSTTLTPSAAAFGTVSNQDYWIKREGSEAIIRGSFLTGTTAASPAVIAMPANLTINATALASTARGRLGRFEVGTTTGNALISSTDKEGVIYYNGSSTGNLYLTVQTTTTGYYANNGTSITGGPAYITFEARVPIAEWAGSGTVQLAQNDVEYASNTSSLTTADTLASSGFASGPSGAAILAYSSSANVANSFTAFLVQFQTPIQATDKLTVELARPGSSTYFDASTLYPPVLTSTGYPTGIRIDTGWYNVSGATNYTAGPNQCYVLFGNNGVNSSGATWANVANWKWRVRKSSAGAAVGFGIVQPGVSSGLVSSSGLPGNTSGQAIAAGYVGEVVNGTAIVDNSVVTTSFTTFSTITLTAGSWMLYYEAEVVYSTAASAGSVGWIYTRIGDSSGTSLIGSSQRLMQGPTATTTTASAVVTSIRATEILNIAGPGTTSYTFQAQKLDSSGTGVARVYNSTGNGQSVFRAVRIA